MRVTFWGVRGSIPTPGPRTARYGGNTSSVQVELLDGTVVLLDGGTGLRLLGRAYEAERALPPFHLLVTHVHLDHLIGVPFFAPLFRPDARVIFHPAGGIHGAARGPTTLFDGVRFPLTLDELPAQIEHAKVADALEPRTIGSARLRGIRLNHPGGSTGYRLDDADGASMVLYTDHEITPPGPAHVVPPIVHDELVAFARGARLLVHDAQYVPADLPRRLGRGHSIVPAVLALGRAAAVHTLALYHHDPERDDDELDAIARDAAAFWKQEGLPGAAIVAQEGLVLQIDGKGARGA